MSEKIYVKTTGQLRRFLANLLTEVKDGVVDIDRASRLTKIAGQINESFYAETKVGIVRAEAGETLTKLGSMEIGDSTDV